MAWSRMRRRKRWKRWKRLRASERGERLGARLWFGGKPKGGGQDGRGRTNDPRQQNRRQQECETTAEMGRQAALKQLDSACRIQAASVHFLMWTLHVIRCRVDGRVAHMWGNIVV